MININMKDSKFIFEDEVKLEERDDNFRNNALWQMIQKAAGFAFDFFVKAYRFCTNLFEKGICLLQAKISLISVSVDKLFNVDLSTENNSSADTYNNYVNNDNNSVNLNLNFNFYVNETVRIQDQENAHHDVKQDDYEKLAVLLSYFAQQSQRDHSCCDISASHTIRHVHPSVACC